MFYKYLALDTFRDPKQVYDLSQPQAQRPCVTALYTGNENYRYVAFVCLFVCFCRRHRVFGLKCALLWNINTLGMMLND